MVRDVHHGPFGENKRPSIFLIFRTDLRLYGPGLCLLAPVERHGLGRQRRIAEDQVGVWVAASGFSRTVFVI